MKKEKCSERMKSSHCCRYTYGVIKDSTLKKVLFKNKWMFNDTWMFWSCFSQVENIGLPKIGIDPISDDNFLSFSGTIHDFEIWKNIIDWNIYGTWFVYRFPLKTPIIKEAMLLGTLSEIPINNEDKLIARDYFSLEPEWKFIHDLCPDLFISKKGKILWWEHLILIIFG
ncbi:MAG: hypothetical protein IPG89_08275 [Bacteroidetes bacterium]|nr:hypothetical protein [Bacteroidota bacterium]